MNHKLVGTWVQIELINGKKWIGKLEEWDDEAIFISNGHEFGHKHHKGAECTAEEASKVEATHLREFLVS